VGQVGEEFNCSECNSRIRAPLDIHGHAEVLEREESPAETRGESEKPGPTMLTNEEIAFLTGDAPQVGLPSGSRLRKRLYGIPAVFNQSFDKRLSGLSPGSLHQQCRAFRMR
jgi:hypothetical protein